MIPPPLDEERSVVVNARYLASSEDTEVDPSLIKENARSGCDVVSEV